MVKQKAETRYLLEHCGPYRVKHDSEGFPYIPGKYGEIQWHEVGQFAVYTERPRLVKTLLAIFGVQRHQMGDSEARMLFPPPALSLVATAVKSRRKRTLAPERAREMGKGTAF